MLPQIVSKEIIEQLVLTLEATGIKLTHYSQDYFTFIDNKQRSVLINTGNKLGHIQVKRWFYEPRDSYWITKADIIIDEESIYIYSRMSPVVYYDLADPQAIPNAIHRILHIIEQ